MNEYPLLGLQIDTHLNWKVHIEHFKSKLSKPTYALRETKKFTGTQTAPVKLILCLIMPMGK